MGRNGFLERQRAERQAYIEVGIQMGRQQMLDMIFIVLNDPQIMGKSVLGKKRLLKVVDGIGACLDQYEKAWQRHDEADYYRAKLDERLEKIFGEELHASFSKRYEYCKEFSYKKGKWV